MHNKKKYIVSAAATGIMTAALLLAAPAVFAQTTPASNGSGGNGGAGFARGQRGMRPPFQGVFGTVTAVNGTTITVTAKKGPGQASETTYSVDASAATVTKDGAASSVSAIAAGDMVMIEGTVNGSNVAATAIRDGMMPGRKNGESTRNMAPVIEGNGQPVIGGIVSAINGTTITVTNKSNVTYTVDASGAKVQKGNATGALADVSVGDAVVIQGTVNGTSVTAASIIDQKAAKSGTGSAATSTPAGTPQKPHGGFLENIGQFFAHLFGF